MMYMGSKRRVVKHILPIMLKEAEKHSISTWIEPFVGGGNVIDKVPSHFNRVGYDINPHTIMALTAIRDYADILPSVLSEDDYYKLKGLPPEPISSWLRFVASFGGQFEQGYARSPGNIREKTGEPVKESRNSAIRQSPYLQGVELYCDDYLNLNYTNCLLYLDPPYRGTYKYCKQKFDSDRLWEWAIEQSYNNIVFVSEYSAPERIKEVWSGEIKMNLSNYNSNTSSKTEKLFYLDSKNP